MMSTPCPLLALPDELFAKVLAFDADFVDLFRMASREITAKVLSTLLSSQEGIRSFSQRGNTSLSQRIFSLGDLGVKRFHKEVYLNASMYGGSWGIQCPKFASTEEIKYINEEILKRKAENLKCLWQILQPIIQVSRNPGPTLPAIEACPEVIQAWMEQNEPFCYGLSLRALPLCQRTLDSIKREGELLMEYIKNKLPAELPLIKESYMISSAPILIENERCLRGRLAEELDRQMSSLDICLDRSPIVFINQILDGLSRLFKKCDCQNGGHVDTTFDVVPIKQKNGRISLQIRTLHKDSAILSNMDPGVTLYFHVSSDLSQAHYFDESELKLKLFVITEKELVDAGFSEKNRDLYRYPLASSALAFLRTLHRDQARKNYVNTYIGGGFRLTNENGNLDLSARLFPSLIGLSFNPPINCSVAIRIYPTQEEAAQPVRESPSKRRKT